MRREKERSVIQHPILWRRRLNGCIPMTKLAIGPSIADGFYYDIDRETPLTAEDLEKIEAEMKKIVKEES